MLEKLVSGLKAEKKRIFLAGWENFLNGDDQCEKVLATQGVDKKTARKLESSTEFIFVDNRLVSGKLYEYGDVQDREIRKEEEDFVFRDIPTHSVHSLVRSKAGRHQLGGVTPEGFLLPSEHRQIPFQYLGFLRQEAPFEWLPSDLHLICPIYYDIDKLFLDYTDPTSPKILDHEKYLMLSTSYKELNPESKLSYEPVGIKAAAFDAFAESLGSCGVPGWIQAPDIPRCPRSNKIMKFVCQLGNDTDFDVKVAESNIVLSEPGMEQYFEKMNFAISGNLYIFFEPETKIACYLVQHT
ncbi:hypothetical protein [Dyadobacter alkalitolerans]|uniref:hypothetical protein n=1 Tax=Dyadobacter alkalitolerans TaxID=492736 RepID=UPI0003F5ACD4|nr:hypothetical protein [Dyadobacter alkalitolerans]